MSFFLFPDLKRVGENSQVGSVAIDDRHGIILCVCMCVCMLMLVYMFMCTHVSMYVKAGHLCQVFSLSFSTLFSESASSPDLEAH